MALSPLAYAQRFDPLVAETLPAAARCCRGFAARLEEAGLAPDALTDVAALDRLPILTKDELLERQQADPPFAGLLADDAPVRRIFQSPGPLYEPELDVGDPWRWAPALRSCGFGDGDVVLNCFGYHLSPAGAMFEEACRALGARVVPAGVGNLDLQAQACADLGVTAYIGLPSYLNALLERAEQANLGLRLDKAFVTAEPLPPSLRAALAERVRVVRQGYGTAETGNLGWEGPEQEGLHVPSDALVQVCDLTTGEARYDGSEGQVVVTTFDARSPVVRFGTGDLSAWATAEGDGQAEPTPRIRGWLGRTGDAVKVRGMFLHPRQVEQAMASLEEIAGYRFVIDRRDHRDLLRCEVRLRGGVDPEAAADAVRTRTRNALRFDVAVEVVEGLDEEASLIEDRRSWT